MSAPTGGPREGSLEAPQRHPLDWNNPDFYNEESLFKELERVFDICHGCRCCFNLCQSFPTLFDAIDESDTMELDGVARPVYWQVVDHCYLCDMCFMTKCPYVPPHEWNLDFPHLMLRAKAVKYRKGDVKMRDRILTSTDTVGSLAGIPVVSGVVNAANRMKPFRKVLDKVLGVHPDALLPEYHSNSLSKRLKGHSSSVSAEPAGTTRGRVALFGTCYGEHNEPHLGEDLVAVLEHNGIPVSLAGDTRCCGMPKLELGDLEAVNKAKEYNILRLARLVDEGWDIVAPVPSCVLMFKQELPLMYPDDGAVAKVRDAIFDPFEYLALRHKHGKLNTEFRNPLGKVAWQVSCHLRVQNIGQRTREILSLVPDTQVQAIERCSGHDGTYTVKSEFHADAMKICKPVVNRVRQFEADHYGSDCPMAGRHIQSGLADGTRSEHPLTLLRQAYGI
jgi:Fe-S oxidoreductase